MAIRAAMSVSQLLPVIWSLGTCRRIHSTDNLLKAEGLSAPLCSVVSVAKPFYFLWLFTLTEMSLRLPGSHAFAPIVWGLLPPSVLILGLRRADFWFVSKNKKRTIIDYFNADYTCDANPLPVTPAHAVLLSYTTMLVFVDSIGSLKLFLGRVCI